jgi:hypothetical protein
MSHRPSSGGVRGTPASQTHENLNRRRSFPRIPHLRGMRLHPPAPSFPLGRPSGRFPGVGLDFCLCFVGKDKKRRADRLYIGLIQFTERELRKDPLPLPEAPAKQRVGHPGGKAVDGSSNGPYPIEAWLTDESGRWVAALSWLSARRDYSEWGAHNRKHQYILVFQWNTHDTNGESGIRTHGEVTPTHAFQACSLSLSDISPDASDCMMQETMPQLVPRHTPVLVGLHVKAFCNRAVAPQL